MSSLLQVHFGCPPDEAPLRSEGAVSIGRAPTKKAETCLYHRLCLLYKPATIGSMLQVKALLKGGGDFFEGVLAVH